MGLVSVKLGFEAVSAHMAGCHHSKLLAHSPGPGAPSPASSGPLPWGLLQGQMPDPGPGPVANVGRPRVPPYLYLRLRVWVWARLELLPLKMYDAPDPALALPPQLARALDVPCMLWPVWKN